MSQMALILKNESDWNYIRRLHRQTHIKHDRRDANGIAHMKKWNKRVFDFYCRLIETCTSGVDLSPIGFLCNY